MEDRKKPKVILIVASIPQFLERGALWFSEREDSIRKAIREHMGVWPSSALIIEQGQTMKPTMLLRKLADLGYEKTSFIFGKGEFASRGNIIEIAPVNLASKIILEFYGNTIEEIREVPLRDEPQKIIRTTDRPFRPGDYVVHLDHGIGIFKTMTRLSKTDAPSSASTSPTLRQTSEAPLGEKFFEIEYAVPRAGASPDKLYVPLSQKKKLDLYIGFETPVIHRLGSAVWFHTRAKAREDIEKFATELLELYRKRYNARRVPMYEERELESRFAETFQYRETPDQKKAIEEIFLDLESTEPMDRILAGDVGFGKTEVALRAALRAITNGKMVLVLAPTTILVEEHLRLMRERFLQIPIRLEALSRLTPRKQAHNIVRACFEGTIDIIIGTHRLFSRDFQKIINDRVGLLIIDEEQRFGVKQKEYFKNLRSEINILSLSATPIPRTLSLALAGLRDISVIETPPPERIPIQTFVLPYRNDLVKEAIARELKRKGQVFFLHNRVETLQLFKDRLQKLLPYARLACIHGRSSPQELARVLIGFRKHELDILVATTIIENGLDFPNANTLIVEDATRLGLSEAHQLRGRIGRQDRDSYAYFLYRSKTLTEKAALRLGALQDANGLGSGYAIALRDLEIRGAGNVLGKEQSGTAHKIGLNLYYHMLAEAVEKYQSPYPIGN